jgi:hypothetical protein
VVEEDPLGETLMEARRATFLDSWPYEKKKGWKPQTKKVRALLTCLSSPTNWL